MRRSITVAAATVALASGFTATPAWSDEIAVQYETFTFTATITVSKFPCPEGCAGVGSVSTTSSTGGPSIDDNVNVLATDSLGCVAGSLEMVAGTSSEPSSTTFTLTRAGVALAGDAVYDQLAVPRTRTYVVEAAMAPSPVDVGALAVACVAGTPLRDVTFTVTGAGERVAVRRS